MSPVKTVKAATGTSTPNTVLVLELHWAEGDAPKGKPSSISLRTKETDDATTSTRH